MINNQVYFNFYSTKILFIYVLIKELYDFCQFYVNLKIDKKKFIIKSVFHITAHLERFLKKNYIKTPENPNYFKPQYQQSNLLTQYVKGGI